MDERHLKAERKVDMNLIAFGLVTHHPAAYALIFILLYPPIYVIGWWAINTFKDWWKKRK